MRTAPENFCLKKNRPLKFKQSFVKHNRHSGPALSEGLNVVMALCVARAAQRSDLFFSYGHKI